MSTQPETKTKTKTYNTWTDVYMDFMDIMDDCIANIEDPDEAFETMERRVELLYAQHKGEPLWDDAYKRWCDADPESNEWLGGK